MWTCSLCHRSFKHNNQHHYCTDKTVSDFFAGKSETSLNLFDCIISKLEEFGAIKIHATKSMLVISAEVGFAYIIAMGKNFIDVVLPFKEPFEDNLCFRKIALVPGSNQYNHHLRIMLPEDINEEVLSYLKRAYGEGKNI